MESNVDIGEAFEFSVSNETCIGCGACASEHPALFEMVEDKALAYTRGRADSVRPWRITGCCPVDAITVVDGLRPTAGEEITHLEAVAGWQAEWARFAGEQEDLLERERRYGRVMHLSKPARGSHVLHVELPRTLPNHEMLYKYGIQRQAPEYVVAVEQIGPSTLSVRARLTDARLRFVAGKINSFPVSLRMDFTFPAAIEAFYHRLGPDGIEVYAFEESVSDPATLLRKIIQTTLA